MVCKLMRKYYSISAGLAYVHAYMREHMGMDGGGVGLLSVASLWNSRQKCPPNAMDLLQCS